MLQYKGFVGEIKIDNDAKILFGRVINTRDVISFQAQNINDMEQRFKDSVDDYLEFCAEEGMEPEKPYSGKFVLRLTPESHKKAFLAASQANRSLNAWIAENIEQCANQILGYT